MKELPEKLSIKQGNNFFREIESCLKADRPRVVLDCSKVRQLDSAGIHVLLRCLEEAMKRNGDVKLASVPSGAAAMLELTRVDRLFEVFDSTADAVNSFRKFPMKPSQRIPGFDPSTLAAGVLRESSVALPSDPSPDSERTMGFSARWLRWQIAGCLALLLVAPIATAGTSRQQEMNSGQQVSTAAPAQSPDGDRGAAKTVPDPGQPESLPNSPGAVRSQSADNSSSSSVLPPSPNQQQNGTQEPLGTAAAPSVKTTGVAASRPAGAAIAPAKQRRARSILIKVSAIVGAGVAVGTVVALSKASPSRAPASR